MNNIQGLIGVDHIISITLEKESPSYDYQWVPESTWESFRLFRKNKIHVIPGHYENRYGNSIENLKEYLSENNELGKHVIRHGLDPDNEGPEGAVYVKSKIRIITTGGKYTIEHIDYFDSYKEGILAIEEIERLHPGKFLTSRK